MGRPFRPIAEGLVYHALNRGNNRARVFFQAADCEQFLDALRQTWERYPFRLYAYCLMKNHFHLVLEPAAGQSISRILQSLTVAHTWHYHKRRRTSGHVWQGRFKSSIIASDEHLRTVMRYVEANPLRAGLVTDLRDYPWSSYLAHGLGQSLPVLDEAPVWASLGRTEEARQNHWRKWVHTPLTAKDLAAVRRSVTTGRPYGGTLGWSEPPRGWGWTSRRVGVAVPPKTNVEHKMI
jgi:putative transposase